MFRATWGWSTYCVRGARVFLMCYVPASTRRPMDPEKTATRARCRRVWVLSLSTVLCTMMVHKYPIVVVHNVAWVNPHTQTLSMKALYLALTSYPENKLLQFQGHQIFWKGTTNKLYRLFSSISLIIAQLKTLVPGQMKILRISRPIRSRVLIHFLKWPTNRSRCVFSHIILPVLSVPWRAIVLFCWQEYAWIYSAIRKLNLKWIS